MKYVDKDTVLLSIMSASNISGNIMDIKEIARRAREINPDIYIVTDAVQHAPHAAMDVEDLGIDGMNFAPYKFFGIRGCGFAYVSDRVASMRHRKLTGKGPTEWSLGTPTPGTAFLKDPKHSPDCVPFPAFRYMWIPRIWPPKT